MSVKDKVKRLTASRPLLENSLFLYYKLRHGARVKKEIARRAQLSLFDYQGLAADIPYGPDEHVIDNNLYGYAQALKNYMGTATDLKAYMEHGLFLGGIVHPDQFYWHFKKVLTMSQKRVAILKEKLPQKDAIAVGPYIHYAKGLLQDNAFTALKKELGKVLLVFPFHSMKGVEAGFEEKQLIKEIKKVSRDFDTVLISLYYLDAQNEHRAKPYQKAGFRVITAGHKFDRHFVNRQRTHIELADVTMSNGMGTQTGFCIFLNKPHYIFKQALRQKSRSKKEEQRHSSKNNAKIKEAVAAEREFFADLFKDYREDISPEQYKAVAEYWGFEDIKTAAELRAILG
jgi:hypothetical protein